LNKKNIGSKMGVISTNSSILKINNISDHLYIDYGYKLKNMFNLNYRNGAKLLSEINSYSKSKYNINKFETLFKNFLNFLIQKRRFFFIERILKSFIEICSRKRGELKAELKSAKELSNEEIVKITEELTKNFSSKIKLNYKHDESLIGGLVVQVGSTMVDTSIKNKLQQIENRMIEA